MGVTDVWAEFEARRDRVGFARDVVRADGAALHLEADRDGRAARRGAIGTPAPVRELLERYERAGLDEVVLDVATGRTRDADVLACLALAGEEVLGAFAARADAADAARDAALAEAVERALARRAPVRAGDPGVTVAPVATATPSGATVAEDDDEDARRSVAEGADRVPAVPVPSVPDAVPPRGARAGAWRRVLETRGESAFRAFVRRSDDERLERTAGSDRGLRLLFSAMEAQFAPERAGGFSGELSYELRGTDGRLRTWTLDVGPQGARARPRPGVDPRLTVRLSLADFVRIAGRDLDAGAALLSGRMDLEGDFSLAARLGGMFGASGDEPAAPQR